MFLFYATILSTLLIHRAFKIINSVPLSVTQQSWTIFDLRNFFLLELIILIIYLFVLFWSWGIIIDSSLIETLYTKETILCCNNVIKVFIFTYHNTRVYFIFLLIFKLLMLYWGSSWIQLYPQYSIKIFYILIIADCCINLLFFLLTVQIALLPNCFGCQWGLVLGISFFLF